MMLPEWARQVAAGGQLPIAVQTCDASIDLSDVRDVVRAYSLLIEKGVPGKAYNVGSGIPRRTGDVLGLLLEAAGASGREVVERVPGRKFDPIADIGQLKGLTGWHPAIALEQTLADTLAWWRARLKLDRQWPPLRGKRRSLRLSLPIVWLVLFQQTLPQRRPSSPFTDFRRIVSANRGPVRNFALKRNNCAVRGQSHFCWHKNRDSPQRSLFAGETEPKGRVILMLVRTMCQPDQRMPRRLLAMLAMGWLLGLAGCHAVDLYSPTLLPPVSPKTRGGA